ncbi:MAG TPA: hypothetical protein VNU24_07230 [Solirubrobacteraceae bacterium]|jgi:tRNA nucleotidyltransferase (CCA-adding enzyme)|nr:hypothetical protein [Solirubrobacteraceae bacterium]
MTSIGNDVNGTNVLERLQELPGGAELLAAARAEPGEVELVGGAVRDILLARIPSELDVVVAGDAHAFAQNLAQRLGAEKVTRHERFQTAQVRWKDGEIDIAMRRSETYLSPGALPEVAAGSAEQDLKRRDFTINAIAVELAGEQPGRLRSVEHAFEDLAAGVLRVLHDASFQDDPTRILRIVRYGSRLGFEIEPHTANLLAEALTGDALQTLSGQRLGAELRLALAEEDPIEPLAELERLGVLRAWQEGVSFDRDLTSAALEMLPAAAEASQRLTLVSSLLLELSDRLGKEDTEPQMLGFLYDLQMPRGKGDAFWTAINAVFIADNAAIVDTVSELIELMGSANAEALVLAAATCDQREGPDSRGKAVVIDWLVRQRHLALQLTGDDLLAAGVPEGREIGERLEEAYIQLLEGKIQPGRENEMKAALEVWI